MSSEYLDTASMSRALWCRTRSPPRAEARPCAVPRGRAPAARRRSSTPQQTPM
eukprot:CAMPEP_0167830500 /NCGR_PEP_ID=MMETSP0112_2-20121227/12982_1 /TAXON_ID=91324 /ORGANISM="Lotharella globosa, Strain CCCM811" /LENGTH=52 /DNA_ID=CAMNT_0007734777 /DNA_START=252 /DNA_END=410 /DNA_ORIENTATION=+